MKVKSQYSLSQKLNFAFTTIVVKLSEFFSILTNSHSPQIGEYNTVPFGQFLRISAMFVITHSTFNRYLLIIYKKKVGTEKSEPTYNACMCRWVGSNHRLRLMRAAQETSSATSAMLGVERGSNPRPAEPQSDALPTELSTPYLIYLQFNFWNIFSYQPFLFCYAIYVFLLTNDN